MNFDVVHLIVSTE